MKVLLSYVLLVTVDRILKSFWNFIAPRFLGIPTLLSLCFLLDNWHYRLTLETPWMGLQSHRLKTDATEVAQEV